VSSSQFEPSISVFASRGRRRILAGLAGLTGTSLLGAVFDACAQGYPAKAVKLIVPFPPGGSTDVAGRVLGQSMAADLGQAFVIDNRAGAAGALGMDLVAKSAPDGYTLGVGGVGAMVTLELLGRKLPYNAFRDLVPVGHMGSLGLGIAARNGLQARNIGELIALAKAQPGKLSYGTSGTGSPGHLAFEYFKSLTGVEMLHVPYKGDAPLTADVIGGQVDIGILTGPTALAQSRGNSLRVLAMTSAARSEQAPQIPTVAESGVPNYAAEIWNVLVAPAGTPDAAVDRLNTALNAALALPAVRAQLAAQGLAVAPMSAKATAQFLQKEREKWAMVIKRSGAQLDS